MSEPLWGRRPSPRSCPEPPASWTGEPTTAAELTAMRRTMPGAPMDVSPPVGMEENLGALLLAFEELVGNGLRHGRPPVRVERTAAARGWLLDVSDAAVDRPPEPAVDRDAAAGGLGLYLVARVSTAHGWVIWDGRKHVWARIPYSSGPAAAKRVEPLPWGRPSPCCVKTPTVMACRRGKGSWPVADESS